MQGRGWDSVMQLVQMRSNLHVPNKGCYACAGEFEVANEGWNSTIFLYYLSYIRKEYCTVFTLHCSAPTIAACMLHVKLVHIMRSGPLEIETNEERTVMHRPCCTANMRCSGTCRSWPSEYYVVIDNKLSLGTLNTRICTFNSSWCEQNQTKRCNLHISLHKNNYKHNNEGSYSLKALSL